MFLIAVLASLVLAAWPVFLVFFVGILAVWVKYRG